MWCGGSGTYLPRIVRIVQYITSGVDTANALHSESKDVGKESFINYLADDITQAQTAD